MVKFTDAFGSIITDGARCMFGGEFPEQMPAEKCVRHGMVKIMNGQLKFFIPIDGGWLSSGLYWDYDGEPCYDLVALEVQVQKLQERWGVDVASRVIYECDYVYFGGNCAEFLDHCTTCGGNWVGMYLTGIERLYPAVYAALPDKLGRNGVEALENLAYVLQLCGVNTAE